MAAVYVGRDAAFLRRAFAAALRGGHEGDCGALCGMVTEKGDGIRHRVEHRDHMPRLRAVDVVVDVEEDVRRRRGRR